MCHRPADETDLIDDVSTYVPLRFMKTMTFNTCQSSTWAGCGSWEVRLEPSHLLVVSHKSRSSPVSSHSLNQVVPLALMGPCPLRSSSVGGKAIKRYKKERP